MKTYYTKCGKVAFQKSSTAAVTRFEEINEHCEGCPYIERGATYRAGQQVPITFCQAGSGEPSQKTDYSTTREDDATTLSIRSLDMELLREIHEFVSSLDGCLHSAHWPNVFHGMDLPDCRKSMPLTFESNKKGKAAKKAIIEKFFPKASESEEAQSEKCGTCENYHPDSECPGTGRCPERMTIRAREQVACQKHKPLQIIDQPERNCRTCANSEMFKTVNHAGSAGNCHKSGGSYPIYLPDGKCKDFKTKELLDPDWPSKNCIDCEFCVDDECTKGVFKNCCPSSITSGVKACPKFHERKAEKPISRKYVDDKNRLIFVNAGLGGDDYMTMYRDQGWRDKGYGMHRLKSQSLPVRGTPEEAQADLDAYAAKKGWKTYIEDAKEKTPSCEKSQCPFHACMSDQCQLEHVIENAPHTVREMVDKVMDYCPAPERLVNSMSMGCGPASSVKCRINDNGWCHLDTASFEDMDAEAAHCGFIRVNDRYLKQKYGVPYKDLNCGHCLSFVYTEGSRSHGKCNIDKEDHLGSRYEGAMACSNFKKKEDDTLKCTKHRCPFNNDEISECGFNPITDDAHRPQMQEARDIYNCSNNELLDVLNKVESMNKTCEGCCYLHKSEICNNTNNQRRATPDTERCGWYWNVKTGEMGEQHLKESYPDGQYESLKSKVGMELVKPEDRYTEDTIPAKSAAFDYSTVDNDTAAFLQEKEQKITQIRMMSVMAIGKELKEVHEKLANNKTGTFEVWTESIGMSARNARRYIGAYEYIRTNCPDIEMGESIQPSLLFEISKPSAPKELQEKVLSGDITTHKQYKEIEEKLKTAEQKAESLQKSLDGAFGQNDGLRDQISISNEKIRIYKNNIEVLKGQLEIASESRDKGTVEDLQKQLAEAQIQVMTLTEELKQPVELAPVVVHETPPEVLQELEQLRAQVDINHDYNHISEALSRLIVLKPGMIDNWVAVAETSASTSELGQLLGNLGDAKTTISYLMIRVQDILKNK